MNNENKNLQRFEKGASEIIKQETINKGIQQQDEFAEQIMNKQISFYRKIFPTTTDRKIEEYKTKLVQLTSDSKIENQRMVKEFERQVLKEALENILKQGKVNTRKNMAEFFAHHTKDLQEKINNLTDTYWDEIGATRKKIEQEKDTEVKVRKQRMLLKRMDEFEDSIDALMANFRNILNEGV